MGNNALARQKRLQSEPQKRVVRVKKSKIAPVEMLLYIGVSSVFIGLAVIILMNSASIYQANYETKSLDTSIGEIQDQIDGLEEEKAILSQPDRIKEIAEKHGLTLNKDQVKNVQSEEPGDRE
ncbi:cell division protein FtsL [Bacillaceae bacterium SIJ1]|uniref:cell division protein FtsL n=1 Tax=Litoribacterium kuwaitense TaxID=1398745 RepID=UPI0013EC928E|nr:cell division protein FtsL [Litoribacterium kuwaitense]NGP44349.1 cell division protein FtsL [Litoribacterium kuwaitense]